MKTISKHLKTAPVILGILLILGTGCGKEDAPSEESAEQARVSVRVHHLAPEAMVQALELVGTVQSRYRVILRAELSERITAVHVEEGDRVEGGALLVELNAEPFRIELADAEASLKSANAQLTLLIQGPRKEDIDAAKARLDVARATLEDLQHNLERNRQLYEEGILAARDWDAFQARMAEQKARVRENEADLARLQAGSRPGEIQNARGMVQRAEAAVAAAQDRLSKTRVTAPQTGVIIGKQVEIGKWVSPGQDLLGLIDPKRLWVDCSIKEQEIGQIQLGQPAQVFVSAYPEPFPGLVEVVGGEVDRLTRTLPIKVTVTGQERLKAGMFARVRIETGKIADALVIPRDSIQYRGGRAFVYVVNDTLIHRREIEPGLQSEGRVQVRSGLKPGDLLVISDPGNLYDGQPAEIISQERSGN